MSTFNGLLQEIPGISIDCFEGDNLQSSSYFLTHCHTDHMRGLCYDFFDHLAKHDKPFYCSHISKSFLINKYPNLDSKFCDKHIFELPMDETRILTYNYHNVVMTLTVCCVSSGHCPGAVMFLFNFNNKRILYTGDFRINKEDFPKLKSLHYGNATQLLPLPIDKVYLDTTFMNLNFLEFPSRTESSKELCLAVKEWIDKDPRNVVILEISALYGSEFIYMELNKKLNKKIHVKDHVYRVYSRMSILADCVTNLGETTPIHACTNKSFLKPVGLKCREDVQSQNILTIIPSVQKWAGKNTAVIIEWDKVKKQTKNVCYSTHPSYNELNSFIMYFKPKEIFPCVCHETEKQNINYLLDKIMSEVHGTKDVGDSSNPSLHFSKHKMFKKSINKSDLLSDDDDSDDS
ncbi:protein artemis [Copidosoma floridanum]|uniref:protein artemis n=1 Tax=Copidosoma floridanum TaxID=29053 RepID=UPI0006C98FBF|nr:protein artemis [Copidosoma floridanum]